MTGVKRQGGIIDADKRPFKRHSFGNVFTEPNEVYITCRQSSHRFRDYLEQEVLKYTVRRTKGECLRGISEQFCHRRDREETDTGVHRSG